MKTYDVMFIIPTDLDQPESDKVMESIDTEIKRQDGKQTESDVMGRRSFARSMGKSHEGHYVRLRIEMDPEKVSDFTRRLKLNAQILRVQILVSDGKPLKRVVPEPDDASGRSDAPARSRAPARPETAAKAAPKAAPEAAPEATPATASVEEPSDG